MLDPFAPWDAISEPYDLPEARRLLALLPDTEQAWAPRYPASIARLNRTTLPPVLLGRFFAKVELSQQGTGWGEKADLPPPTPCWLWTAGTHDKGYGRFYLGRDPDTNSKIWAYSHRISFEHFIGFAPDGYIIDHECNHKLCCNPTHLWPQTNNDNLRLADQRRPWKRRNQYSKE